MSQRRPFPVLLLVVLSHPALAQQPARSVIAVKARSEVETAAARIDSLVEQGLQRAGQQPNPTIDDATFVRRAYLANVGRIPTLRECEAFLADQGTDKRGQLIDELLDAPGHVSSESNFWADLLRARSRLMRQVSGEPFLQWIKDALVQDLPYDRMVTEMLTATGAANERGKGATGFLLRDLNMPHDAMANTLRVFLGTRLECAQCHNHPFDKWTQKQFYEMAAFFGGLQYRANLGATALGQELRATAREADDKQKQLVRRIAQQIGVGLQGSGNGQEHLPADYKYDDSKPRAPVFARTIFGAAIKLEPPAVATPQRPRPQAQRPARPAAAPAAPAVPVDSRATLASWLCSKDNPRFAAVIANRMWQKVFGRGLVEPIDDWKDDTKASNPELLQYLARLMVDLKFDLRQFQRVLLSTRTFQRAVPDDDCRPDQPYLFPGPVLSRMRAEQLWDSLLTLVFDDLDQRLRPTDARSKEVYDRYDQYAKATPEQLHELLGQAAMRTADPQQFQQQQRSKLQQGRLAEQAEKQRQARPLYRELQQAQKNGDLPRIAALTAQLRELGVPLPGERAGRGREGDLLRASDLPQPAPAGHLLRQFGQSDRETVDGGNAAASVPQVLTLLNGFLDQRVLNGGSALRATVAAAADPAHKVAAVYLAVLSRPPAPAEQTEWSALLHGSGDAALRDLVWVLCNSHEFRFVR